MCAIKFRQQRGTKMYVFQRIRFIAKRYSQFYERAHIKLPRD